MPPARTFIDVAIADSDNPVRKLIELAISTINSAPIRPAWPTTQPARKNRINPNIVSTFGVNTPPNVPKRADAFVVCPEAACADAVISLR